MGIHREDALRPALLAIRFVVYAMDMESRPVPEHTPARDDASLLVAGGAASPPSMAQLDDHGGPRQKRGRAPAQAALTARPKCNAPGDGPVYRLVGDARRLEDAMAAVEVSAHICEV